ncbi:MAG: hypothetical protein L0099_06435, partial [Acidobacteria bacterium]|nr:hypothetical protein [Acidobacteriota bacterium]
GKYNSSLTRVQPVFDALHHRDPTGRSWLAFLLALGSRSCGTTVADIGDLTGPPQYEFEADPDPRYLLWLASNPDRLVSPDRAHWRRWSARTQRARRRLLKGEPRFRFGAMTDLVLRYPPPRRAWWRLEGSTKVDCALATEDALIFVEGKRTELSASKDVLWYRGRNQILRNLDCAREMAFRAKIPNYYVLLVVEGNLCQPGSARWTELQQITAPETVESSFPHLNPADREEIMRQFLGYTTWEEIAGTFGLTLV